MDRSQKEVCKITGLDRHYIQDFDKHGIATYSGKNKYKYLQYDEKTVAKIINAGFCHELGMSMEEIRLFTGEQADMDDVLRQAKARLARTLEHGEDVLKTCSFVQMGGPMPGVVWQNIIQTVGTEFEMSQIYSAIRNVLENRSDADGALSEQEWLERVRISILSMTTKQQ